MCWNATVSFLTFFVGSCVNATAYFILQRMRISKILIYWQYALIMQLVEGVAWIQYNDGMTMRVISMFALLFNVTQPIILALVVRFGMKTSITRAIIANIMYVALIVSDQIWEFSNIAPARECNHLELRYWNVPRTTLYMLASLISFSEIPDRIWAVTNTCIFVGSLLIAILMSSCGVGSLFCWLIAVSGVVLVAVHYVRRLRIEYQNNRILVIYR